MLKIIAVAAPIVLSATFASAGVVGSDAKFDNIQPTRSAEIVCTDVYRPDGSRNCRTILPETPSIDPLEELTVEPGSIFDYIRSPGPVPIVCTDAYFADGSRNCLFDDVVASPINPITCTLRQTADGRLVDSCGPTAGPIEIPNPITCTLTQTADGQLVNSCGPVSTNPVNQVPAPGGLVLILAGLGIAMRLRQSKTATS